MLEYKNPAVTVDSIILRMHNQQLEVLTMKRTDEPYRDKLSLIGGFVKYGETIDESLLRVLKNKAQLELSSADQAIVLPIVSDGKPDIRGWIFTVPVVVMLKDLQIVDANLQFKSVSLDVSGKLVFDEKLAFDHNHVLELSLNYLRNQLLLHNYKILRPLLNEPFTSRELYNAVHLLTGVDKTLSNFMRETAVKKSLVSTGERVTAKSGGPSGQPALLYMWS